MLKNVAYLSAVLGLFVFSGCSTNQPAIDATSSSAGSAGSAQSGTEKSSSDVIAPISSVNNGSNAGTDANGKNGIDGSDQGLVSILFDYDKFNIRSDMEQPMQTNSGLLKGKTVKLEGNCDEFGSDEYNFALGLKRANSVKTALVNAGMNPDNISMISLGEGNPVCTEKTQECWAKNRRVDFKLP